MISTEGMALDITDGKLVSEGNLGDSVPTRRSSMRKIKEVLRLRFELGLGQREIARACSISQGAVHNYLKKAAAAGSTGRCQKVGTKNVLKKRFSAIHSPSNDLVNVPFPTFLP